MSKLINIIVKTINFIKNHGKLEIALNGAPIKQKIFKRNLKGYSFQSVSEEIECEELNALTTNLMYRMLAAANKGGDAAMKLFQREVLLPTGLINLEICHIFGEKAGSIDQLVNYGTYRMGKYLHEAWLNARAAVKNKNEVFNEAILSWTKKEDGSEKSCSTLLIDNERWDLSSVVTKEFVTAVENGSIADKAAVATALNLVNYTYDFDMLLGRNIYEAVSIRGFKITLKDGNNFTIPHSELGERLVETLEENENEIINEINLNLAYGYQERDTRPVSEEREKHSRDLIPETWQKYGQDLFDPNRIERFGWDKSEIPAIIKIRIIASEIADFCRNSAEIFDKLPIGGELEMLAKLSEDRKINYLAVDNRICDWILREGIETPEELKDFFLRHQSDDEYAGTMYEDDDHNRIGVFSYNFLKRWKEAEILCSEGKLKESFDYNKSGIEVGQELNFLIAAHMSKKDYRGAICGNLQKLLGIANAENDEDIESELFGF